MSKQIQISDAEWQIMKVLWQEPSLTSAEVMERLADSREWHANTVRTMLTRLQKKKVLEAAVVDKLYRYTPLLTRDECIGAASASFLSRVFDGAVTPMFAHFVKSNPLSKKDRAELERIIGKYKKEK